MINKTKHSRRWISYKKKNDMLWEAIKSRRLELEKKIDLDSELNSLYFRYSCNRLDWQKVKN